MKHVMVLVAIGCILIGAVAATGITWQLRQSEVDDAWQSGYTSGTGVAAVARVPASISASLNTTSVGHANTVAAAGGVATQRIQTKTLYINNTGETLASGLRVYLKNPVTGREGIDNELETADTDIYIATSSGVNARLYRNGEYTTGIEVPNLGEEDTVSFTLYFEMETATDGTYVDGQTYDCEIYVSQGVISGTTYTAFYTTVVDYTWTT